MNFLSSVITYFRRYCKLPSSQSITDALIIDYINRFWMMDVDARIQLFDLKTKYSFVTQPGVDRYNMPLYNVQVEPGPQNIAMFPVYQGFLAPCYINGVMVNLYTLESQFNAIYPNYVNTLVQAGIGNGNAGPYTLRLPFLSNSTPPSLAQQNLGINSGVIRGHVDMTGIISTGVNQDPIRGQELYTTVPSTSIFPGVYFTALSSSGDNIVIQDSGQFLPSSEANGINYGLLMAPGNAPFGYSSLPNGGNLANTYETNQNTINYLTGVATNVYFPAPIPDGMPINASCVFYQTGIPLAILYYNNTITLRCPPNTQYIVELEAYLSPCAFISTTQALPFAYMAEYIALGAVRKLFYETGDKEQLMFYEPLFLEQEALVWKRSQRQFTATRTPTIYSAGPNSGNNWGNGSGIGLQ